MIVLYKKSKVGFISKNNENRICFEYARDWLDSPSSFPISQSIPLSGDYSRGMTDHRFFVNLLPEAAARESICRGLGISVDNDYELLKAIGGDCAGALQVLPSEEKGQEVSRYEPITNEIMENALTTPVTYNRLISSGKLRLSLAGAQDKWPVYFKENNLFWPVGSAASSHILKFENREFKGLTWNEAYTTFLYGKLDLPVVQVAVKDRYTLTERYDRYESDRGILQRYHQEDFCQALGYSSFTKYENEGGASLAALTDLIRSISMAPALDVQNLIKWQIANLLLGNSDGHMKNLSILYTPEGSRLAPFYDLVNTRVYDGISRDMALSVGGCYDPGQIRGKDWEQLAGEIGVNPRIFFRILQSFSDLLRKELDLFYQEFTKLNGTHPVLERINQSIMKQVRRTNTLLK